MSITLGSNIASLQAQRQLFKTDEKLSSVFERLSSGQRINRASDDAAGLAISESLNTDRRVFNQAIRNLNDGLSVLDIADSTVAELSGIVIRIQELAEQAANGSLSSTQRKSLDAEAQELKDEFFRVSRSADFNGLRLIDGSIEDGVRLQAGYGTDGSIFSSLGGEMGDGTFKGVQTFGAGYGANSAAVGDLNGDGVLDLVAANQNSDDATVLLGNTREGIAPILDFSLQTQADALQALGPLERKLQSLSEQRGTIGAFQSRLQSALNTLSATSENYAAAESRIKDAYIAFESSQLTRLNILQQAASAVLGQANQQPALALQLLGGG